MDLLVETFLGKMVHRDVHGDRMVHEDGVGVDMDVGGYYLYRRGTLPENAVDGSDNYPI